MRVVRRRSIALVAVAALGLTGCSSKPAPPIEVTSVTFPSAASAAPPPGTTLKFGEIATLQTSPEHATQGETTVLKIIKGTRNDSKAFQDPQFNGYTPYYVITQSRRAEDAEIPLLVPVLSDNTDGPVVKPTGIGSIVESAVCPINDRLPDDVDCIFALAPAHQKVIGLRWYGTTTYGSQGVADSPYAKAPINWLE